MQLTAGPVQTPCSSRGTRCMLPRSLGAQLRKRCSRAMPSLTGTVPCPDTASAGFSSSAAQPKAPWTDGRSQQDYMLRDQCITVDGDDCITGSCSKLEAHQFNERQPRGRLHRAFSVFLFNSDNRLLLQQRAASKITFPLVWTNTCCSHQLTGFEPDEVDDSAAVTSLQVTGSKHAAVRKLQHELGISPAQVPLDSFQFWTRLHYCAADKGPDGEPTGWGEHEMDYVLGVRADVTLRPHPDEVRETRWVTWPELRELMRPGSGLAWSPWFRVLAEQHLEGWWADLDAMLAGAKHVGQTQIHAVPVSA